MLTKRSSGAGEVLGEDRVGADGVDAGAVDGAVAGVVAGAGKSRFMQQSNMPFHHLDVLSTIEIQI